MLGGWGGEGMCLVSLWDGEGPGVGGRWCWEGWAGWGVSGLSECEGKPWGSFQQAVASEILSRNCRPRVDCRGSRVEARTSEGLPWVSRPERWWLGGGVMGGGEREPDRPQEGLAVQGVTPHPPAWQVSPSG